MPEIFITKKILLTKINLIEGWLSDHEAILLYNFSKLNQVGGEIVEIGSWKGKSTICLAYGLKESGICGFVWSVDPHEGKLKAVDRSGKSTLRSFLDNLSRNAVAYVVKPIVKTSLGASKYWTRQIRILFIDGIHDYEHTTQDYERWGKFVVPGGVIAFHDAFCGEIGVWQAVNQYLLTNKCLVDVGTVSSILFGVMGKPNLLNSAIVGAKICLIRFANVLNNSVLPKPLKMFIIHRCIRILLLNKYSLAVYL
jgi:hypothetical protein